MAARFPDPPRPIGPIEDQINNFFDRIIMCVNARRIGLLATVQETRNAKIEGLRRRIEGRQQLEATKEDIEKLIKENILRETQEILLREVERKLEEMTTPLPGTRIVFRGDYGHLKQLVAALGEIREEEVRIVAVGKEGKAPGELLIPKAVAIDRTTNRIYVTEGDVMSVCSRISIFSEEGEFLNSYAHEHMNIPHGIAIHRNNMYITDIVLQTVFRFKIEPDIQFVTKVGKRGTGNGEFCYPFNLSVSGNGDVYVADRENNRIQILDSSLNYIQNLTEQSIPQPRDIKLTADSVYLLCQVSPCIRVFSYKGDMLRSLITLQVNEARHFCLDAQLNIIISDRGTHNIKVFTKEGTLIHTIGKKGHEIGRFNFPHGISLINEMKLVAVSWNVNYGLQIFSSL